MGRGPDGRRMCKLCGLTGGDVTRIKNHIESVHWPHSQGYACEQCSAICKTRHALACHKSRHHPKNKTSTGTGSKRGIGHVQHPPPQPPQLPLAQTQLPEPPAPASPPKPEKIPEPEVEIKEEATPIASPEPEVAPTTPKRDSRGRGKRASKRS